MTSGRLVDLEIDPLAGWKPAPPVVDLEIDPPAGWKPAPPVVDLEIDPPGLVDEDIDPPNPHHPIPLPPLKNGAELC